MNIKVDQLVNMLMPDPDNAEIGTGANVTLTIAVSALLIAQVIADSTNDIVRAIDRASGNS